MCLPWAAWAQNSRNCTGKKPWQKPWRCLVGTRHLPTYPPPNLHNFLSRAGRVKAYTHIHALAKYQAILGHGSKTLRPGAPWVKAMSKEKRELMKQYNREIVCGAQQVGGAQQSHVQSRGVKLIPDQYRRRLGEEKRELREQYKREIVCGAEQVGEGLERSEDNNLSCRAMLCIIMNGLQVQAWNSCSWQHGRPLPNQGQGPVQTLSPRLALCQCTRSLQYKAHMTHFVTPHTPHTHSQQVAGIPSCCRELPFGGGGGAATRRWCTARAVHTSTPRECQECTGTHHGGCMGPLCSADTHHPLQLKTHSRAPHQQRRAAAVWDALQLQAWTNIPPLLPRPHMAHGTQPACCSRGP
jgi:hypothetical protein